MELAYMDVGSLRQGCKEPIKGPKSKAESRETPAARGVRGSCPHDYLVDAWQRLENGLAGT